jgi:Ca2+-binding EF-hand superfamily protein
MVTLEKALLELTARLCPSPSDSEKKEVKKPHRMGLAPTMSKSSPKPKVYEPAPPATTRKTTEELKKTWSVFDYNNNGILSLAEIDRAVQLTMPQYFKSKPVLIRAYKAADISGDGYIQFREFETVIHLIEEYEVLWQQFQAIDKDGDRRISLDEFKKGYSARGLPATSDAKLAAIFNEMDSNRGGVVLFDEFVMYLAKTVVKKNHVEEKAKKAALAPPPSEKEQPVKKNAQAPEHALSTQRLRQLWQTFDYNGNGFLSLAEIDRAVQLTMSQYFKSKPVLIRAYKAADISGDGYIQYKEFKMLLRLIEEYQVFWNIFQDIDTNGDRRLSLDEFKKGGDLIRQALPSGCELPDETIVERFNKIDRNKGGVILFDEFVFYLARISYDAKVKAKEEFREQQE